MSTANDHESTPLTVTDRPELQKPPMYQVLLLNDDFTPMDFVVEILRGFFQKPEEEATRIMLSVHHEGRGLCGLYPYEIAESKVAQVEHASQNEGYPLRCVMEKISC
ncbi:MAG TPA: ATP-dependent Clp protease adapter ClpS [Mariprofundaceae bacterium]|nr:ATP-dependent Clp protease adapter ClpS [Mariprofundaceae bacterium]